MSISYPPNRGSILRCNFYNFRSPEMTKMRPVIVLSPSFSDRPGLCTVVACSSTKPTNIMPYHYEYHINPVLPSPYNSSIQWIKGDMLYSVSFDRLDFIFDKKNPNGKRIYDKRVVPNQVLHEIEKCVAYGLGIII